MHHFPFIKSCSPPRSKPLISLHLAKELAKGQMERVPSLVRHAQIDSPEPRSCLVPSLGKTSPKAGSLGKGDQRGPAPLGESWGVSSWALPADPHPRLPTEIQSVPSCCWHRSPEGWTCSSLHRYPRPPAGDWLAPLLAVPRICSATPHPHGFFSLPFTHSPLGQETVTGLRLWFYEKQGTKRKLCLSFLTSLSQKRQDRCRVRLATGKPKRNPSPLLPLPPSSVHIPHTGFQSVLPFTAWTRGVVPCTTF